MSLVSFPYSRQKIDNEDIKSVTRLLKKDIITQGQEGILFEKKLSSIVKSKYATSFNSATSALHAACHALSISKNDLVWTVTNSFVASANCALYCGAKIDFLDINNSTWNMDINKLKEKLLQAKKKNLLPKVIINVHIGGLPENQKKLWKLSKEYNFKIIEDASHSLGASYCREQVGSCKWSDITVFSFHPVKIITTGEGGMATTNNKIIDDRLKVFRSHGITKNPSKFIYSETKKWQYEQQVLGYNYRMSDISAALGISQLSKLKKFVKKRNEIAKLYKEKLKELPIRYQAMPNETISSYHLFIIRIDCKGKNSIRDDMFNNFRKNNIYVNLHYKPIHLQPFYRKLGFKKGQFPEAESYAKDALSIPIFYNLKKKDLEKIVNFLKVTLNET